VTSVRCASKTRGELDRSLYLYLIQVDALEHAAGPSRLERPRQARDEWLGRKGELSPRLLQRLNHLKDARVTEPRERRGLRAVAHEWISGTSSSSSAREGGFSTRVGREPARRAAGRTSFLSVSSTTSRDPRSIWSSAFFSKTHTETSCGIRPGQKRMKVSSSTAAGYLIASSSSLDPPSASSCLSRGGLARGQLGRA
jgi:hypothetical protein